MKPFTMTEAVAYLAEKTIRGEIKPCPFCGSVMVRICRPYEHRLDKVTIMCQVCCASKVFGYDSVEEALDAWNYRGNGELIDDNRSETQI